MQQGPQNQDQEIHDKIIALRAVLEKSTEKFASFIAKDSSGKIDPAQTLKNQTVFMQILGSKVGLNLTEAQAKKMLQQADVAVNDLIALGKSKEARANPNVALTIQIALATTTALLSPSVAGSVLAIAGTRQTLHKALDSKLGVYSGAIETSLALLEVLEQMGISQYNIRSYGSSAANYMVKNYGILGYLAIPAAMILYNKGPELLIKLNNSHLVKTMVDFTDIMYGLADDETIEAYNGSIATMTPDEVLSSVVNGTGSMLSWLWSKTTSLRSSGQPSAEATPDPRSSCASSELPRM